jgi:hypothetical protein
LAADLDQENRERQGIEEKILNNAVRRSGLGRTCRARSIVLASPNGIPVSLELLRLAWWNDFIDRLF